MFSVQQKASKWNPEMLELCINNIDKKRCDDFGQWLRVIYASRKVSESFPQTGMKLVIE